MTQEHENPDTDFERFSDPVKAIDRLCALHQKAVEVLQLDFAQFAKGESPKTLSHSTYPYIFFEVASDQLLSTSGLSYGRASHPGRYGGTVTRPDLFYDYLLEQLSLVMEKHKIPVFVGKSQVTVPLTFALEDMVADLPQLDQTQIAQYFAMPNLVDTHDIVADGDTKSDPNSLYPVSLFTAERVDYSLHRLKHYTGTSVDHFQRFVIFTNYQRYVDEFIEYGQDVLEKDEYEQLVGPGNKISNRKHPMKRGAENLPQMPAYHLTREDKNGITLINIGIGPSNAKTITDHLAVLRPHCWLMVGHCGGLRRTQQLGDYVLAHAYLRDDHVLDDVLPTPIPLPTIAEVQVSLTKAISEITGLHGKEAKERNRTGTVVTTDDRNWELRYQDLIKRLNQSRAIAIDMESATIAANGYRFRVPYGTLLCVSDRPLHGEIKLPGMANAFYEKRISQHLKIGIRAIELIREEALAGTLHSRKLRSFDEPPFR